MDGMRFDNLTRALARRTSRRSLVRGLAATLLGSGTPLASRSGADARRVTQAQCGNVVCADDPSVCADGCVCCGFGNGNSRCMPPRSCRQHGGVEQVCPAGQTLCGQTCIPVDGCCGDTAQCPPPTASCQVATCEDNVCGTAVAAGTCRIAGACYAEGERNPVAPCQICDPAISQTIWSNAPAHTPCADGDPCNGQEACDGAGHCAAGIPVACDSPGPCQTGPGACNTETGACEYLSKDCDDGLNCTDDSCDPTTGCVHTVRDDACLIDGVCYADGETNPTVFCQICDPAQGREDWSPRPDGAQCESDDLCSVENVCRGGECAGTPKPCSAPDVCHAAGACDPATGTCANPVPIDCDDGLDCTIDTCDPESGCVHTLSEDACLIDGVCYPAGRHPDGLTSCLFCRSIYGNDRSWVPVGGAPCDDGNLCTELDTCQSDGRCVGIPKVCNEEDDGLACTVSVCDPATGECAQRPAAGWCLIDGDCYTEGDLNPVNDCQYCDPATSQSGWSNVPRDSFCNLDNPCAYSVCNGQGACVFVDVNNHSDCDDGRTCCGGVCACDVGLTCCDGVCVDLSTDPNHCNDCNYPCGGDAVCVGGRCLCGGTTDCNGDLCCDGVCLDGQNDPTNCGGCRHVCPAGQYCVGSKCVDNPQGHCNVPDGEECASPFSGICCDGQCLVHLQHLNHCGACDRVCPSWANWCSPSYECLCGNSQCEEGQGCCHRDSDPNRLSDCTDFASDVNNCGACGNVCPTGTGCVAGECVCPDGWITCDGTCVDPKTDLDHCGGCRRLCRIFSPGGLLLESMCCAGVCTDPLTDPHNCSICGNSCNGPLQTGNCIAGGCQVATCPPNRANCDGDPDNGCEVDLLSDVNNCGACGNACNCAGAVCANSTCCVATGESCEACHEVNIGCCNGAICLDPRFGTTVC